MSTAATMRVLSVLRHWISKHREDFDSDARLKNLTIEFLDDVLSSPQLLPAEHKAASQLLQLLTREDPSQIKLDLSVILARPIVRFIIVHQCCCVTCCYSVYALPYSTDCQPWKHWNAVGPWNCRTNDCAGSCDSRLHQERVSDAN